jgi:VWFA-related protein
MNQFSPSRKRATPLPAILAYSLFPLLLLSVIALGQASTTPSTTDSPSPSQASGKASSELSSHDEVATFKVKVNLVLVRVVVRDSQGRAVGNLKQEDFQLFDSKKQQVITKFAVEQPGTQVPQEEKTSQAKPDEAPAKLPSVPERYVAYLFDDVHLNPGDLMQARNAADHHLESLEPTDRAAIFTTSGQTTLDFTDDHKKLHQTLLHLQPRPIAGSGDKDCPDVTYYMADLIQNKNDPQALQVATLDALACAFQNNPRMGAAAQAMAQAAAAMQLGLGNHETLIALGTLKGVVQRISVMPGQRTVILVSPGFFNPEEKQQETEIIERAVHSNVIISALDARGLYIDPAMADISQPGSFSIAAAPLQAQYRTASASADADIMAELADGTGGSFFHNNNDMEGGFRRLAAAPEYYYLLGFSPQNLKLDGRYHSLKVTLKLPEKLSIQARRGYYAPKHIPDAAEQAKQEIEEALFSQEEVHDLPVDLHTQFFKTGDNDAKLSVLAHLDVRRMHFRKVDGRNGNELTVVSCLFDRNGQLITGNEKILTMRLRDETLEKKLRSGVTMKASFDVKPGSYLVRLVVRDTEGQISAENSAIEIP